jgi:Tfp pilus assembly protein PilN
VRAVNLLPIEERRGVAAPGRTGYAPYAILAALGLILIGVLAYVLVDNTVKDRRGKLARVKQQTAAAQAEAAALKPYRDFAALSQQRLTTVQSLARTRFDWEQVIRDLSKALPSDTFLTAFSGSIASTTTSAGTPAGAPAPSLSLTGCANDQIEVARTLVRLRLMHNVSDVELSNSQRAAPSAAGGASAGSSSSSSTSGGTSCSRPGVVTFNASVAFQPLTPLPSGITSAPSASSIAQTTSSGASTSTPAAAGSTTATTSGSTASTGTATSSSAASTPATTGTKP